MNKTEKNDQTTSADFEKKIGELQKLVDRLESDAGVSLEESIKLYEDGLKLTRECVSDLNAMQARIADLNRQLDIILQQPRAVNIMSKIFDARLADWKEQIDAELKAILDKLDYSDGFKEILEYALFPGGKRLRPVLMLEWHSIFSAPDEYALRYACGIEILHSYSLIHDDMPCMDNDDIRRGKPSVHKKYGEGKALLAGDALLDLAYRLLSMPTPQGEASPFAMLSALCGDLGLIQGQYVDLYGEINTFDDLVKMYKLKTGALIRLACISGFMLGNNLNYKICDKLINSLYAESTATDVADIPQSDMRLIEYVMASGFGDAFGCAFQLYDDITEYIDGEEVVETSALKYMDLEQAKIALNDYLNDAAKTLDVIGNRTEYLRALLQKFVVV